MSCSIAPLPVPAEVYKWVDQAGRVHYGDAPPAEQGAQVIQAPKPPSDEEALRANKRLDELLEKQRADANAQAQAARRIDREARMRRTRCRAAKEQLHILGMERPLYRLDEQGNRLYIEDDQRASELTKARKRVNQYCR